MLAGHIEERAGSSGAGAAESWVGSVAVCRASDLAASGAGDGSVQLWALEDTNRVLKPLHKLPVVMHALYIINLFMYSSFSLLLIACDGPQLVGIFISKYCSLI